MVEGRKSAFLHIIYLSSSVCMDIVFYIQLPFLFIYNKSCLVTIYFFLCNLHILGIGWYDMVKQKCMAAIEYKKMFKLVSMIIKSLLSRAEIWNTDMYSLIIGHVGVLPDVSIFLIQIIRFNYITRKGCCVLPVFELLIKYVFNFQNCLALEWAITLGSWKYRKASNILGPLRFF